MVKVLGILVELQTEYRDWAGTDDHLWIGVVGKSGGREFCLDVRTIDDFEPGTDVKYWFGEIWDGSVLSGAEEPWSSREDTKQWNDPSKWQTITLEDVDYVYLRKGGTRRGQEDDAYILEDITVTLYGPAQHKRAFRQSRDIRLSNESGLQVWLYEI